MNQVLEYIKGWIKTMPNRPTRFYSDKQEKKVVKTLGGRQTPNSGATPWVKGDVLLDQFLVECKTSMAEKQSFSIPKKWLEKMQEEAFSMGKPYSALCFDYGDGINHYIIDEKLFKKLTELLKEETE